MRLVVTLTVSALLQLVALYLMLHWAERAGEGIALRSLLTIISMALAIPGTLVVNAWIVLQTARRPIALTLVMCSAIALLVPAALMMILTLIG